MPGIKEFTPQFFDASSDAWMKNKLRIGAMTLYKCTYAYSSTRQCNRPVSKEQYCIYHQIDIQKKTK